MLFFGGQEYLIVEVSTSPSPSPSPTAFKTRRWRRQQRGRRRIVRREENSRAAGSQAGAAPASARLVSFLRLMSPRSPRLLTGTHALCIRISLTHHSGEPSVRPNPGAPAVVPSRPAVQVSTVLSPGPVCPDFLDFHLTNRGLTCDANFRAVAGACSLGSAAPSPRGWRSGLGRPSRTEPSGRPRTR